jgi:hypothetical protein
MLKALVEAFFTDRHMKIRVRAKTVIGIGGAFLIASTLLVARLTNVFTPEDRSRAAPVAHKLSPEEIEAKKEAERRAWLAEEREKAAAKIEAIRYNNPNRKKQISVAETNAVMSMDNLDGDGVLAVMQKISRIKNVPLENLLVKLVLERGGTEPGKVSINKKTLAFGDWEILLSFMPRLLDKFGQTNLEYVRNNASAETLACYRYALGYVKGLTVENPDEDEQKLSKKQLHEKALSAFCNKLRCKGENKLLPEDVRPMAQLLASLCLDKEIPTLLIIDQIRGESQQVRDYLNKGGGTGAARILLGEEGEALEYRDHHDGMFHLGMLVALSPETKLSKVFSAEQLADNGLNGEQTILQFLSDNADRIAATRNGVEKALEKRNNDPRVAFAGGKQVEQAHLKIVAEIIGGGQKAADKKAADKKTEQKTASTKGSNKAASKNPALAAGKNLELPHRQQIMLANAQATQARAPK